MELLFRRKVFSSKVFNLKVYLKWLRIDAGGCRVRVENG